MSDAIIRVGGQDIQVSVGDAGGLVVPSLVGNDGKFLTSAGGELEWATGTGADAGLRTDLAAEGGGLLVGKGQTTIDEIIFVTPEEYGAIGDGATNDATAIQTAIDAAESAGVPLYFARAAYKLNSGVTVDLNTTSLIGNGATFDFTGMASGVAIDIINSDVDNNARAIEAGARKIEGFVFRGPGVAVSVQAMRFNDAVQPSVANNNIIGCSFWDFASDVDFGIGAFCNNFERCTFTQTGAGTPADYSIKGTSSTNAGERQTFSKCMWFNRDKSLSPGTQTFMLDQCSLDYASRGITVASGGAVYLSQCHIEFNATTDYWCSIEGNTASTVHLDQCEIVCANAPTTHSPFYVDSVVLKGGLSWGMIRLANGSTFPVPLVQGTGRVLPGSIVPVLTSNMAIGEGANLLAHGGFEDVASLTKDGWSISADVARSTAEFHTGTASMEVTGNTAGTRYASQSFDCRPGQILRGELWYKTADVTGSGGTVNIAYSYLGGDGTTALGGEETLVATTTNGTWTRLALPNDANTTPAPKGTRTVKLTVQIFSVTSGSPKIYVDGVKASVA